jgi:LCP family protein required for cell wall assembly
VTGPYDGPPDGGTPPPHRPLPPELDPRRPATRRPAAKAARPPKTGKRRGLTPIRDWSKKRILATVAGGMACVLVASVAVAAISGLSILHALNKINPFPGGPRPGGGAAGDLNILIVGSDSRAGLTKAQEHSLHVGHDAGQRSDTMILLHIPSGSGKADMVSLPRDSYVTIPAHCANGSLPVRHHCATGQVLPAQKNKLNAAYSEGGAKLTIATIEHNTHVRIDHYIEINFLGFVNMVNKLGGVPVCNAKAINDPIVRSSTGQYSGSGLELPAGTTTLKGPQALEYVRAREFDPAQGDLGRIERQQKFMAAMLNKAESTGVLLDLPKLYGFLKSVASSLTVDKGLGTSQMFRLARRLHSMSPKNVNLLTVPLSNTALATPVGSSVLWDPVLSKRLFHDFSADKPITNVTKPQKLTVAPSNIELTVLNATSTSGLAAKASQALAGVGFAIGHTGNAPKAANPSQTVVLYGPTRADSAKTVAAAVPGSIKRLDNSLGNGIELLVGSNYSTVKAVKVSTSTTTPSVRTGATNPCS